MELTVRTTLRRDQIPAALAGAVRDFLADTSPDSAGASGALAESGRALLERIHAAFLVKSGGGTDEAGGRWAPLKKTTVAYRATRTRAEATQQARPSQSLSRAQRERWWRVYRQGLYLYRGDKNHAARRAWFILKEEGARTLLDKYGGSRADILNASGRLLRSLEPPPSSAEGGKSTPEQVFRVEGRSVTIGTARPGAAAHHRGVPGRLPQRRLWPPPSRWPGSWWRAALLPVRDGLVAGIVGALSRG